MPAADANAPAGDGPVVWYHHARPLVHVRRGLVVPVRQSDHLPQPSRERCGAGGCADDDWHLQREMEEAYDWLARRVGCWPLFLAVGTTDEDRRMTGYQNQWSRSPQLWGPDGPPRDLVLFSWSQPLPGVVHTCFQWWHAVLNAPRSDGPGLHDRRVVVDEQVALEVLRPDLDADSWRRRADEGAHSVQAVVPMLNLNTADVIWAPNQRVAHALRADGFDQVMVRRLRMSEPGSLRGWA